MKMSLEVAAQSLAVRSLASPLPRAFSNVRFFFLYYSMSFHSHDPQGVLSNRA